MFQVVLQYPRKMSLVGLRAYYPLLERMALCGEIYDHGLEMGGGFAMYGIGWKVNVKDEVSAWAFT